MGMSFKEFTIELRYDDNMISGQRRFEDSLNINEHMFSVEIASGIFNISKRISMGGRIIYSKNCILTLYHEGRQVQISEDYKDVKPIDVGGLAARLCQNIKPVYDYLVTR